MPRALDQAKPRSHRAALTRVCGCEVPRDHQRAVDTDRKSGDHKWQEAWSSRLSPSWRVMSCLAPLRESSAGAETGLGGGGGGGDGGGVAHDPAIVTRAAVPGTHSCGLTLEHNGLQSRHAALDVRPGVSGAPPWRVAQCWACDLRREDLSGQGCDASRAAQGVMDCLMGCGLPTAPLLPGGRQRLALPCRRVSATSSLDLSPRARGRHTDNSAAQRELGELKEESCVALWVT